MQALKTYKNELDLVPDYGTFIFMSETTPPKPRQKLKMARVACGLSLRKAAAQTGYHYQTIVKLEKGLMGFSEKTAERLSKAYGCKAHELIDDGPEPSATEKTLMQLAAGLSEDGQIALLAFARMLQQEAARKAAPQKKAASPDPAH